MANVPRGAPKGKKAVLNLEDLNVDDLVVAAGLTLGTTDALTVDTINAISAKDLVIAGADGKDVKVKLGDDDAGESFIVEEVDGDDLLKVGSTGLVTLKGGAQLDNVTAATELKITEDVIKHVGASKFVGEITTRNAADNSMYHSIAASSGHERGVKLAFDVVANDGGYFDAVYANARSGGITGGEIRGLESKATILHNMDAGAIATGVYAKVNVSGAAAEVAKAIGVDVLLEEEDSGTVTEGTGVRIQGGAGVVTYGLDISGVYDKAAAKLKVVDGDAAISIAALEAAFGTDDAKDGLIGLYIDNNDAVNLVFANGGKYKYVALTSVDA